MATTFSKKSVKNLTDAVTDVLLSHSRQIRKDVFNAAMVKSNPESFSEADKCYSKLILNCAFNAIEEKVDALESVYVSFAKKKSWHEAEAFLFRLRYELTVYESRLTDKLLTDLYFIWRNGKDKSVEYVSGIGDFVFTDIDTECSLLDNTNSFSIRAFWQELSMMLAFVKNFVENLLKQLYEKKYNKAWSRYDNHAITIEDIFIETKLVPALKKLEEVRLIKFQNGNAVIIEKSRGTKSAIIAWYNWCFLRGYINAAKHNTALCAKVILQYFGYPANKENDIRMFQGNFSEIPMKYQKMFGFAADEINLR